MHLGEKNIRKKFLIAGQVQGVGFRPFVCNLALELGLRGFVRNTSSGVLIEAEGSRSGLDSFSMRIVSDAPLLSRIDSFDCEAIPNASAPEDGFAILASQGQRGRGALLGPDTSPCPDCLAEMRDPANRRHCYAFTNCTACGPRYTITRELPYDRHTTSMRNFAMCPDCALEYGSPENRRFHAQPNSCPECGPALWLACSMEGARSIPDDASILNLAAISKAVELVRGGGVLALKGAGGFHLVCNAADELAIARLRERKHRPDKPFAVMVGGIASARSLAMLGAEDEALLQSQARPIVLCELRDGSIPARISRKVSPDTGLVGLMLPSSPLHQVFFDLYESGLEKSGDREFAALVMTSGNHRGSPLVCGNEEAVEELGGFADAFLLHNRDIAAAIDDSVIRSLPGGGHIFIRRARGYVPAPLELPGPVQTTPGRKGVNHPAARKMDCPGAKEPGSPERPAPPVLAVGADLKSTVCLAYGGRAFVSQHIGDLENLKAAEFHRQVAEHLRVLLDTRPEAVVRDAHPGYVSSVLADEYDLPVHALQHHYAHAWAVLSENGHVGPAMCVALDGTGFGLDNTIWGGEFLFVDTASCEHRRLAHFSPMRLPGGQGAILEPWKLAHGLIYSLGLPVGPEFSWMRDENLAAKAVLIQQMLDKGINCPVCTSCGRLFDAVSAMLGLCSAGSYEGQAAIRLERALGSKGVDLFEIDSPGYPCPYEPAPGGTPEGTPGVLLTEKLFSAAYDDFRRGVPVPDISARFHLGLAFGIADLCLELSKALGVTTVGISGGCMQNAALTRLLGFGLKKRGLIPLFHQKLPPNDACISYGQAAWFNRARPDRPGRM